MVEAEEPTMNLIPVSAVVRVMAGNSWTPAKTAKQSLKPPLVITK